MKSVKILEFDIIGGLSWPPSVIFDPFATFSGMIISIISPLYVPAKNFVYLELPFSIGTTSMEPIAPSTREYVLISNVDTGWSDWFHIFIIPSFEPVTII